MPTYQYRCADCGHRFDAVQSFSDDALTTCPECGGELRKVYGSVGVVFKGSGFYRTDSRAEQRQVARRQGGGGGQVRRRRGVGRLEVRLVRRRGQARRGGLRLRFKELVGFLVPRVIGVLVRWLVVGIEGRRQLRHAYWTG